MSGFLNWFQPLQPYMPLILIVLLLFCLALLILFLLQLRKSNALIRQLRSLTRGAEGIQLEEALGNLGDLVNGVKSNHEELANRLAFLEKKVQRSVQGIALERYNAFADTSGDLSFSWALLDSMGNGTVITGIYGREEYRLYAKPLRNSASTYPLSEEEKRAIQKAEESILGRR
ncbi:MAG: DUF4446 family protein [bacterium]|nr:DUF4446 family protein [Coprothermobacterota bacterium]